MPTARMLDRLPYAAFERDALIRTAEVALGVANRGHLFLWMQLHLHRFVPHDLVLCHLPLAACGDSTFLFHSMPVDEALSGTLTAPGCPLLTPLRQQWVAADRQPTFVPLHEVSSPEGHAALAGLRRCGVQRMLVHGVDASAGLRSESFFAFGCSQPTTERDDARMAGLALWMPYLHACTTRALAPARAVAPGSAHGEGRAASPPLLTARELQILQAVRHARRTDEIAQQLGISPLTVKNHVRKIMSKLGARSRVHAVAEALSRQIIS